MIPQSIPKSFMTGKFALKIAKSKNHSTPGNKILMSEDKSMLVGIAGWTNIFYHFRLEASRLTCDEEIFSKMNLNQF